MLKRKIVHITIVFFLGFYNRLDAKEIFSISLEKELPLFISSTLIFLGGETGFITEIKCIEPCNPDELNIVDKGTSSLYNPTISLTSDIILGIAIATPIIYYITSGIVTLELKQNLKNLLIIIESILLTGAITEYIKNIVQRPRPYAYNKELKKPEILKQEDTYKSFFSGHTSLAFATLVSFAYIYHMEHKESIWRWIVWSSSIILSSLIGGFRILSGKHFPTDVITGAVVGTIVGILVPIIHQETKW